MSARTVRMPAFVLAVGLVATPAVAGVMGRVSVSSAGAQGTSNAFSSAGRILSSDGRFVVFQSAATNVVAGDTNSVPDIFLRDRVLGTTVRMSVASDGTQASARSDRPALSGDGSSVAFDSAATNLVPADTNVATDVFVRDVTSGVMTRVSVASDGTPGNRNSFTPALSADGRIVAFESTATNLVPGDTNGFSDVFVHDRLTGETVRVSVGPGGVQGNQASMRTAISADGRYVAFESIASNLVANDTNNATDIFVFDRATGTTTRASVATDGTQANGASGRAAISGDGRFVVFDSTATTLVPGDSNGVADVFVHDMVTGETLRASVSTAGVQGGAASIGGAISADGRFLAFESTASNLVSGDTNIKVDVFVRDLVMGTTTRASIPSPALQSNADSVVSAISGDGSAIAFESIATNLVTGDTNGMRDVFVWSMVCPDGIKDPDEVCDDGNGVSGDGCDVNCTPTGCQNGVVTAGEQCDDGNGVSGDGCDANCTITACGNGIRTAGEQCDDGNTNNLDGCRNDCLLPFCGDGYVDPGEVCDDGNGVEGDGCDSNCTPSACGNGIVAGAETCDDANLTSGDGCDANCTPTGCGNGIVTAGEACDDGNGVSGDGCDANCTPTSCGNGILTAGEACDDGNLDSGDGCDANCTLTGCGNGIVTAGEACDDGNGASGDGCDANCTPTACGNGVVTAGEACDDGNGVSGDGCDANCTPTGCGNGIVTADEACDDGNLISGDGCDANCTPTGCGNGVVTAGEACDDGNLVSGDGCDMDCSITGCGNGILTAGEQCDDGNLVSGDGCDANCTPTGCGNGIVTGTEVCDDGNLVSGDGCDANCKPTGCGNGVVAGTEVCDDGNLVSGDGCDANCKPTGCGNGIITAGEDCDDGNTFDGDACPGNCKVESGGGGLLCTGGMKVDDPAVIVRTRGRGTIDDRLVVKGRLLTNGNLVLSPLTTGAQLLVEDLGGSKRLLVDLTGAKAVPPGGPGTGCDRFDGWRTFPLNRVHLYRNRSNDIDPPACHDGSAQGLRWFQFIDHRRDRRSGIDFVASMRGPLLDGFKGPIRTTVVLGRTSAAAAAGRCGSFTTRRCEPDRWGLNLVCR